MIITITIIINDYYLLLPYVMIYYKLFSSPYSLSPESTSNITDPLAPYDKIRVLIKKISLSLFVESPLFNLYPSQKYVKIYICISSIKTCQHSKYFKLFMNIPSILYNFNIPTMVVYQV